MRIRGGARKWMPTSSLDSTARSPSYLVIMAGEEEEVKGPISGRVITRVEPSSDHGGDTQSPDTPTSPSQCGSSMAPNSPTLPRQDGSNKRTHHEPMGPVPNPLTRPTTTFSNFGDICEKRFKTRKSVWGHQACQTTRIKPRRSSKRQQLNHHHPPPQPAAPPSVQPPTPPHHHLDHDHDHEHDDDDHHQKARVNLELGLALANGVSRGPKVLVLPKNGMTTREWIEFKEWMDRSVFEANAPFGKGVKPKPYFQLLSDEELELKLGC